MLHVAPGAILSQVRHEVVEVGAVCTSIVVVVGVVVRPTVGFFRRQGFGLATLGVLCRRNI